jgi:hypothetical protein
MIKIEKFFKDLDNNHGLKKIYDRLLIIYKIIKEQLYKLKEIEKELKLLNKESKGS